MSVSIKKAAVLGAGVMGSAIAAHFAGAGIADPARHRAARPQGQRALGAQGAQPLCRTGLERALAAKPAAFYDPEAARLITIGNLDDHLDGVGECDLVIEAVVENLDVKHALFEKLAPKLGAADASWPPTPAASASLDERVAAAGAARVASW